MVLLFLHQDDQTDEYGGGMWQSGTAQLLGVWGGVREQR